MPDPTNSLPVPLPRCCERHPDWATLSDHLGRDFADIPLADVVAEVARAKAAVDGFGMAADEILATAELIARQQLMLRSGRASEGARLDPETHARTSG